MFARHESNILKVQAIFLAILLFLLSSPAGSSLVSYTATVGITPLMPRALSILFYDNTEKKFRRKTFFCYGSVNNEVERALFDIAMEPLPKQFEGMRWRSFIRKISDDKAAMGLEVAKKGEDFKNYGETILTKTK